MILLNPPNSVSWIDTHQNPLLFSAQNHCSCSNRVRKVVFECRSSGGDISGMEFLKKIKDGIGCLGNWKEMKEQELGRKVETQNVAGGQDVVDAAMAHAKINPHHLVIMVNGLVGSASDWKFASDQFVKQHPDKIMVHRSQCNTATLTFDGVDMMGERLADEVLTVVSRRPGLEKISFIAHSLGGLIARYAIAKLYEPPKKLEPPAKTNGFRTDNQGRFGESLRDSEGRIAGLEPMNFITVATPHLGSRGHKQLPFLCGVTFLERQASQTAHLIAGKSGKHLFLTDEEEEGRPPLLVRMVSDSYELKFISALGCFKRRVAYANANYDQVVGWSTSSIRRLHELPKASLLEMGDKYPHIVHIEHDQRADTRLTSAPDVQMKINDLEEKMIRGLNQLTWERVDVSFHKSRQRYIAHNTIQVKSYWLNSDGEDVICHMIDNFLV